MFASLEFFILSLNLIVLYLNSLKERNLAFHSKFSRKLLRKMQDVYNRWSFNVRGSVKSAFVFFLIFGKFI